MEKFNKEDLEIKLENVYKKDKAWKRFKNRVFNVMQIFKTIFRLTPANKEILATLSMDEQIDVYKEFLMYNTRKEINFIKGLRIFLIFFILLAMGGSVYLLILTLIMETVKVSEHILIAIITGVFSQVIGLFIIVVKYAFNPIDIMLSHITELIGDQRNKQSQEKQ